MCASVSDASPRGRLEYRAGGPAALRYGVLIASQRKLEGSWQRVPLVGRIAGIPALWAVELIRLDVTQIGKTGEEVGKWALLRLRGRRSPLCIHTCA